MHIIINIEDESLQSKVKNDIHNKIESGIIPAETAEDVMNLFDLLPDVEAVCCTDSTVKNLIEEFKKRELFADLIYLGESEYDSEGINFHKISLSSDIGDYIKNSLNHQCVDVEQDVDYYSILSSNLKYFKKIPVDLFMQIKKEGFNHYIKYVKENDQIDDGVLSKLSEFKKVFIKQSDKEKYFDKFNEVFLSKITKDDIDVRSEIFNQLVEIGFTEKSCKVAKATMDNVIDSAEKGLLSEINKLYKAETSFRFRKSFMIPIVVLNIAKNLNWVSESNKEALILSSLFCDRAIEKDEYHYINDEDALNISSFNDEERELVDNHAKLAADWILTQKDISQEVERVIRQHHGTVNGIGFSHNLTPQITQLSILFIVGSEFSHNILMSSSKNINIKELIESISKKYSNAKVDKILKALFASLKAS